MQSCPRGVRDVTVSRASSLAPPGILCRTASGLIAQHNHIWERSVLLNPGITRGNLHNRLGGALTPAHLAVCFRSINCLYCLQPSRANPGTLVTNCAASSKYDIVKTA